MKKTRLSSVRRTEKVKAPSFPMVPVDQLLTGLRKGKRWQVVCGDARHYRIGIYSPEIRSVDEIAEFERHSCDEFFILLDGEMSLALMEEREGRQKVREVKLRPLKPILVRTWHAGFCPKGPFTGRALVVERDRFLSEYVVRESSAKRSDGTE